MKKSFSRSNVNESTLNITDPLRSSFDLSHRTRITPKLGAFHPVSAEFIMPSQVFHGSVTPELKLEKVVTPEIGRTKLHTHTFMVPYRRIMNDFKQYMERRPNYDDVPFPSFDYAYVARSLYLFLVSQIPSDIDSLFGSNPKLGTYGFLQLESHSPEYPKALTLLSRLGFAFPSAGADGLVRSLALELQNSHRYRSASLFLHAWALAQYYGAADTYYQLSNYYFDIAQRNFPSDFYVQEYTRLTELGNYHYDILYSWLLADDAYTASPNEIPLSSIQLLASTKQCLEKPIEEILRPYLGINSNADYLGYPIYRQYGDFFEYFRCTGDDVTYRIIRGEEFGVPTLGPDTFFHSGAANPFEVDFNAMPIGLYYSSPSPSPTLDSQRDFAIWNAPLLALTTLLSSIGANFSAETLVTCSSFNLFGQAYRLCDHASGGFAFFAVSGNMPIDWPTNPRLIDTSTCVPVFRRTKTELALRAAYACWFDEMRDWHLEHRDNVEDPDTWSMQSLFFSGSMISPVDVTAFCDTLSTCYALLVPKQLYYAKDMLTTIQTEDVYRHVYAPIYSYPDDQLGQTNNPSSPTGDDDIYNKILNIFVDGVETAFPYGSLHRFQVSQGSDYSALRNDLQTMRRTGMLEKWLARNYFYPDTYSGQIEAHYGVTPEDFKILYSTYIGGNESDFTGEQLNNATSTAEAPAGTRTFLGGAGHTDQFSNTFSDYAVVVSFVSVTPFVEYDAANPHLDDHNYQTLPFPEYGLDARITCSTSDFLRGFGAQNTLLGYVPRYLHYRARVDEVHGRFLNDLRAYTWIRDWYNMFTQQIGANGERVRAFTLHPYSMRIHLPLDAFLGLAPWDSIAFGQVNITFMVNVPLPAAVETF